MDKGTHIWEEAALQRGDLLVCQAQALVCCRSARLGLLNLHGGRLLLVRRVAGCGSGDFFGGTLEVEEVGRRWKGGDRTSEADPGWFAFLIL
jgi:hypothetical protein